MNQPLAATLLTLTLTLVPSWSNADPAPDSRPTSVDLHARGPGRVLLTVKRFLAAIDAGDVEVARQRVAPPTTVGFAARLDGDEPLTEFRQTLMGCWFDQDLAARPQSYVSPAEFVTELTRLPVNTTLRHEVRQGIAHCASQDASAGILEIDRVILRAGEEVSRHQLRVSVDLHWADDGLLIHSWHASPRSSDIPIPPTPGPESGDKR